MKPSPWFRKAEIYFYDLFGAWQGDFDCLSFIENLTMRYGDERVIYAIKKNEWYLQGVSLSKVTESEMKNFLYLILRYLRQYYDWIIDYETSSK